MKAIKMKKMLLAIGLGLGLSGAISAPVLAGPDSQMCAEYKIECSEGNERSCQKFDDLCWWRR